MKNRIIKTKYTVFLSILCAIALSSCDEEIANSGGNSKGNTYLKVSVNSITEPDNSELTSRSKEAETVETVTVPVEGQYDMACTLERIPLSTTRGVTHKLPTGTTYRVIVYKGSGAVAVAAANYVGYRDYIVGSESSVPDWYFPEIGNYRAVCYSYSKSDTIKDVINSSSTTLPANITPSTDVLYYAKDFTLTKDNVYELGIDFSHVFSRVKVIVDASSLGEVITKASAKLTPTYAKASLALATGNATPTVASDTTNVLWNSSVFTASSQAVTSDSMLLCMNNTVPTLTFQPGTIRSGASSTDDMPNKAKHTVTFSNPILQGYRYVLRVNLLIPKLNVVVIATDNNFGYDISKARSRAGSILNAPNNFGPAGTVKCGGFNYVAATPWPDSLNAPIADRPETVKALDWIRGTNYSGNNPNRKIADLLYIAYYARFSTQVIADKFANYLKGYLKNGGVVVLYPNAAEGEFITKSLANLMLSAEFSGATQGSYCLSGSIHALPGNPLYYLSSEGNATNLANQAMLDYAGDPILDGSFGNVIDKQWGNDADTNSGIKGLTNPVSSNLTIYSRSIDISGPSLEPLYTNPDYVNGFRYETEDYNWVFFSDGGFMSLYNYSTWTDYGENWTHPYDYDYTICPLNVSKEDGLFRPLPRPHFGRFIANSGAYQKSVYNAIILANTFEWAVKKSYYYLKKRYNATLPPTP